MYLLFNIRFGNRNFRGTPKFQTPQQKKINFKNADRHLENENILFTKEWYSLMFKLGACEEFVLLLIRNPQIHRQI